MTTTTVDTQPRTAVATSRLPVRRHGSVEVPAAGLWPLQISSHIVRAGRRHDHEQLHIRAGWLDVDADPTQCWFHIELDGRRLDLTAIAVVDDTYGLSAWHLTGVADSGDRRDPMTMALRYHGVFRRGDETWAWFSGTAVIEGTASGRRSARRPAERLHVDLSFQSRQA